MYWQQKDKSESQNDHPIPRETSYTNVFNTYAELCDDFITQAKNGNPYDTSSLRAKQPLAIKWIFISIGIGLVVGICVVSGMSVKMKTVHSQSTAKDYMKKGSLDD